MSHGHASVSSEFRGSQLAEPGRSPKQVMRRASFSLCILQYEGGFFLIIEVLHLVKKSTKMYNYYMHFSEITSINILVIFLVVMCERDRETERKIEERERT